LSIYPATTKPWISQKKKITKKKVTHDDKRDVGPVRLRECPQLLTDRHYHLDAVALPDTARKVWPMIEELAHLKQVQRHRVQLPLMQHGVRRVVQQPGIRAMCIELEDLGQRTYQYAE
jgi:hypothetical protein